MHRLKPIQNLHGSPKAEIDILGLLIMEVAYGSSFRLRPLSLSSLRGGH